ncbi:Uncharacterised protein [Burkholderia pseudomallei]|uniref:hypothetical protein n=1 Tax=Burkholderia pseudomallei TaxID=28450 RepID=UPI000F04CAE3|nr:hypothetical protein [Burkholderia pseudomallei]CAJ7431063.1 Uncharacterised protein [Burkholderia pseudomallei]VBG90873.1 Uncharacterised protein [Burkholderia pseudomallei]VBR90902.1 Uncharacterised protein [Burkholderia pseudomallei]
MAIKQWLHLSELGSDPWVLPIYTAWNKAVDENRVAPRPDAVTEAGVHITTRLNLVRHIMRRLRRDFSTLVKEVDKYVTKEHQYTPDHEGIALSVDDHMKYLMIADFHSVISEVDACIDRMKVFMEALHDHVGQHITDKQRIAMINSWMKARAIDPTWFNRLASARNFIAHVGAFYLALDTSEASWDLLLVKGNTKQFDDPSTYVRVSSVMDIINGFVECRDAMQAHLIALLETAK